jgi:hypothetical protein
VPFDLSAAGTSLATAGSPPPLEDDDADVDVELAVELDGDAGAALEDALLLLLLLPHAATGTTHASTTPISSGFLQLTIRLLLVCDPGLKRIRICNKPRERLAS